MLEYSSIESHVWRVGAIPEMSLEGEGLKVDTSECDHHNQFQSQNPGGLLGFLQYVQF